MTNRALAVAGRAVAGSLVSVGAAYISVTSAGGTTWAFSVTVWGANGAGIISVGDTQSTPK